MASIEPERIRLDDRGVTLAVRRRPGTGPPLVLLHGTAATGLYWERLMGHLPPEWDVILPDLRGHGLSDKPATGYAPGQVAADVAWLLSRLEVDAANVAGHSWGGKVAVALAAGPPEAGTPPVRVRHLVAVDPMALGRREADPSEMAMMLHYFDTFSGPFAGLEEAEARVRALVEAIPGRRWTEQSARTLRRTLFRQPDGTWVGPASPEVTRAVLAAGMAEELTPLLPRLACPVTLAVVRGREPEFAALVEMLPDVHLEGFDCSHWIPSDRPAELAALMIRRLSG